MARKKYVLFRDQTREFYKKGWESKVIGVKGNIILVEAEVPEKTVEEKDTMVIEDLINEPKE